jgi:hypothetical protein
MNRCPSTRLDPGEERQPRHTRVTLLCLALICWSSVLSRAQQSAPTASRQASSTQSTEALDAAKTTGVILGTVTDSDGALVASAQVVLLQESTHQARSTQTDSAGEFHFEGVAPGDFRLTITSQGLAPASVSGTLKPAEISAMPTIRLRVATANTEVNVSSLTQTEVATEQVHAEEEQRVLGVIPNYFVSYANHPAPLRAKQKFGLGWHVILDPTNFLFAGAAAGIEQASNTFPGYGGGPQGYGKRYGAALVDSTSSTLLRGSVYPSLFHQDPRYFYKGSGTVWQRARYALATAVICKGDNGRWQPNYSGILGDLSAGALSNLYYPASSRNGAALTFENGLLSTAGIGVGHLMQEFLFKHVSTHVPKSGKPQP